MFILIISPYDSNKVIFHYVQFIFFSSYYYNTLLFSDLQKKSCAKAKCHNNNNNNNNNNLFLIRCKLTSEYDQMRLTTITACNNYNKVYLRVPKNNIYNLKFINLTITGKSLPK